MGIEAYGFAIFLAGLICIVAIVFKVLFSNVKAQSKLLDERETQLLQTYNAVETIMEEFQDQAKATIDELKHREDEYRHMVYSMDVFHLPEDLEKRQQVMDKLPRTLPLDANRIKAMGDVIERAEHLVNYTPVPATATQPAATAPAQPAQVSAASTVRTAPPPAAAAPAAGSYAAPAATPSPAYAPQSAPAVQAVPATPAASAASATTSAQVPTTTAAESKPAVFQKFFDDAVEAPPPTPYAPSPISGGSRRDEILSLAAAGKTDLEIAGSLGITRSEVKLVIGLTQ